MDSVILEKKSPDNLFQFIVSVKVNGFIALKKNYRKMGGKSGG